MNVGSIAFAGITLAVGVAYEWIALKMPLGSLSYPGPGLYPVIVGAFLVATALGCFVQELLARSRARAAAVSRVRAEAAAPPAARAVTKTTYQLMALTVGYILLLKPLGYPIAIFAFLGVAIRIFGYRRWLPTVAMAGVI